MTLILLNWHESNLLTLCVASVLTAHNRQILQWLHMLIVLSYGLTKMQAYGCEDSHQVLHGVVLCNADCHNLLKEGHMNMSDGGWMPSVLGRKMHF